MGIELIIGAVLPVFLELLGKVFKGSNSKFVVALILPLLIGAGLNWESLDAGSVESILGSGAIIFAAAQGVYKLYFKVFFFGKSNMF